MKEFLALHNRTVTRTEIEAVIEAAKEQQNTAVIYRLSRILNAHPSTNSFVINIRQYPETQGLSGAQHTSDYREALDENGRLRKGYKFVKGKIIPAQLSQPSQDDEITFLAAAGIDYLPEAPDDEPQGLGKPLPAADIYKMVTDKVISMFKDAKASDYHRAWKDDAFFIPLNYDSKKPYRGVNRLLLEENIGIIGSFANPYFLTFKQIKKHGGKLKKGSKGYEVIYYSFIYSVPAAPNRKALKTTEVADVIAHLQKHNLPESVVKRVPLLRYYRVFNGKDVEGIQFNLQEVKIGRAVPDNAPENQAAQSIVENYPNAPEIKHGGNRAYYSPPADYVQMPNASNFDSANDYYRTLFHELIHSTGHPSRLNRELNTNHKSEAYAKEELTAEMGAVFLSAWAGILWYNNKNHAAYLKSWNNAIKEAENDSKFIMQAAAAAQKATDYILNLDANGQPAFLYKYEKPKKKEEPKSPTPPTAPKPTQKAPAARSKKAPRAAQYTGVKTIPLSDLYTDEKRFQNRKKLNEEIVDNIVQNFKPTDLDPLVVWYDKKQDKTFVLAGHHRFEALKRLKHKIIPVKYANEDYPTEADAIRYAKEISNANRTLEEPYERAAIYRKYREEGYSEKDINEKAALEGKNRSYILNLSWLNPKGATMSTLVQFSQTQSKADKNEAERIADWIGQARRNAPELTDAHEKEMFDFLTNKEASKRTTNKAKFLEYVRACYNPFEPTEPLNLARIKYQSEGEKQYDEEVEELKNNINKLQGNITDIKDRFINPNNPQYINPTAPDYLAIKQIADNKIAEYNAQIQYYQKKLLEVYQNKKNYIKPTGQMALFGKYPETDTQRFKKMKEVGKKKSASFRKATVVNPQDGRNETLSANTTAKSVPNSLNLPDTPNLAAKMVALQARNWESFKIANPQMQRFLGDVELKESESTVITIGGGAGSGKTRFAFQFINALAQNYKVGHASLEEHPDSKLYYDKVKQYLDPTALANVEAPEIKNLQQLDELIQRNEVIVIDSFAKLRELDSRFMLDRDLRKKYNSKLFLLIYQLTGDGKMRGGSESEFDGDIILLTHVSPDYRENYIYPKKNRYNALPATQLRYSTYYQQMLPTEDTLSGTKEASNNTYEIIY